MNYAANANYRAWNYVISEMQEVVGFDTSSDGQLVITPTGKFQITKGEVALMVQSPIKDAEGRYIFDGDIIEYAGMVQVVGKTDQGHFFTDGTNTHDLTEKQNGTFTIIGNVFEHRYLLTEAEANGGRRKPA